MGVVGEDPDKAELVRNILRLAHYNREGQPISEEAGVVGKNYSFTERSNTTNITVTGGRGYINSL